MQKFWDNDGRRMLYEDLLCAFGPFREWGKSTYPKGKKSEFDDLVAFDAKKLSRRYGREITASAVCQQIKWGTSGQRQIKNRHQYMCYIANRAAAEEVGFIASEDLPNTILMHY